MPLLPLRSILKTLGKTLVLVVLPPVAALSWSMTLQYQNQIFVFHEKYPSWFHGYVFILVDTTFSSSMYMYIISEKCKQSPVWGQFYDIICMGSWIDQSLAFHYSPHATHFILFLCIRHKPSTLLSSNLSLAPQYWYWGSRFFDIGTLN